MKAVLAAVLIGYGISMILGRKEACFPRHG